MDLRQVVCKECAFSSLPKKKRRKIFIAFFLFLCIFLPLLYSFSFLAFQQSVVLLFVLIAAALNFITGIIFLILWLFDWEKQCEKCGSSNLYYLSDSGTTKPVNKHFRLKLIDFLIGFVVYALATMIPNLLGVSSYIGTSYINCGGAGFPTPILEKYARQYQDFNDPCGSETKEYQKLCDKGLPYYTLYKNCSLMNYEGWQQKGIYTFQDYGLVVYSIFVDLAFIFTFILWAVMVRRAFVIMKQN